MKARFYFAESKARALLYNHGINKLPVNIEKIIEAFDDLQTITYQQAKKHFNCTEKEISEQIGSKDGVLIYSEILKKHLIVYNENVVSSEQKTRFTLAHELGHYVLDHLNINDSNNLIVSEYHEIYEKEANAFARELLAPQPVLMQLDIESAEDISNICNITLSAAEYIKMFLTKGMHQYNKKYSDSHAIVKLFENYIEKNKVVNKYQMNDNDSKHTYA